MAGYSKQFLIGAFLSRFVYYNLPEERIQRLESMASTHYDEVGKDKFRASCSLDAAAIKEYKANGFCNL